MESRQDGDRAAAQRAAAERDAAAAVETQRQAAAARDRAAAEAAANEKAEADRIEAERVAAAEAAAAAPPPKIDRSGIAKLAALSAEMKAKGEEMSQIIARVGEVMLDIERDGERPPAARGR